MGYGINNRDNVIEIELRDCTDGSIARFKAEVMDSPIFRFEVGYEFTNKWDDSNDNLKESRVTTRSAGLAMGGEIWCLGSRGSIGYRAKILVMRLVLLRQVILVHFYERIINFWWNRNRICRTICRWRGRCSFYFFVSWI